MKVLKIKDRYLIYNFSLKDPNGCLTAIRQKGEAENLDRVGIF